MPFCLQSAPVPSIRLSNDPAKSFKGIHFSPHSPPCPTYPIYLLNLKKMKVTSGDAVQYCLHPDEDPSWSLLFPPLHLTSPLTPEHPVEWHREPGPLVPASTVSRVLWFHNCLGCLAPFPGRAPCPLPSLGGYWVGGHLVSYRVSVGGLPVLARSSVEVSELVLLVDGIEAPSRAQPVMCSRMPPSLLSSS